MGLSNRSSVKTQSNNTTFSLLLWSITYLTHGLKKLLDECNVLGEQLWHAAVGDKVCLFNHKLLFFYQRDNE